MTQEKAAKCDSYRGFGVYKITCIENSKFYIGSSSSMQRRLYSQKNALKTSSRNCPPEMLCDFEKYGEQSFEFEVLEVCASKEDALKIEQALIDRHKESGLLYNRANAVSKKRLMRKEIFEKLVINLNFLEETRRHWHSRIVALGLTKDEFTLMAGVSSSVWYAGDMKLSTAKKIEDKLQEMENLIGN